MKKIWPFMLIFFFLPLFIKKEQVEHFEQVRPQVPNPIQSHPWVALQNISDVSPEMVRDIEKVETFAKAQQEDVTPILIRTLLALQADLPFQFPQSLYNVLCIAEAKQGSFPYRVYKRVYFGETDLGMPMYLDVRVFDAQEHEVSQIMEWHFGAIKGEFQPCGAGFFGEGFYETEDLSHGFAPQRALYLLPHYKDGRLYVLFSDVPSQYGGKLWEIVSSTSFLGD